MSHKGATGYMGYTGNEQPIVIALIDEWNKLGKLDGFIGSMDDRPMPEYLKKLLDAINSVREHLKNNPPPEKTLVEQIITQTKSF